jgi:PAS domain S-box-containing protein
MNKELKSLIVEDSALDAELIAAMLAHGWEHVGWRRVDSKEDFIHELAWRPDIIIADHEVPGFGAPAALELLQEMDVDIPLIVCTGAVTEETVVRCMRLGAADYLLKDRLTRLGPAVENALAMRRERLAKQHTQREQQRLAALNSALLDSLPAQAALLDTQGSIIATNAAWRSKGHKDTFTNPEWGVGCNYANACMKPAGRDNLHAVGVVRGITEVLAGRREQFAMDYPSQAKHDAHWFRVLVTRVTAQPNAGGAVVMHVDVTERRSMEEQLKVNANALQHLAEGVVISDAHLRVVAVNKAYSTMTGYDLEEVKGLPLWTALTGEENSGIPDENHPAFNTLSGWRGELNGRHKNGKYFRSILSVNPVPSEHGQIEHYTAVLTDQAWQQPLAG